MDSQSDGALQLLRNRLATILVDHPTPSDEDLPYLMNLAADVADAYPALDAATVLNLVADEVRRFLP